MRSEGGDIIRKAIGNTGIAADQITDVLSRIEREPGVIPGYSYRGSSLTVSGPEAAYSNADVERQPDKATDKSQGHGGNPKPTQAQKMAQEMRRVLGH